MKIYVIMGVSGSGKTTVGKELATQLGFQYEEGDDYHTEANRRKMQNGISLTDQDRMPWLERLNHNIKRWIEADRRNTTNVQTSNDVVDRDEMIKSNGMITRYGTAAMLNSTAQQSNTAKLDNTATAKHAVSTATQYSTAIQEQIATQCNTESQHDTEMQHGIVLTCSALKRSYREVLAHNVADAVQIVHLYGHKDIIASRLQQRRGHFMPPGLLDSQYDTLEIPGDDENVWGVSIEEKTVQEIVETIVKQIENSSV